MLLDEPANDVETLASLENALGEFSGCTVIKSCTFSTILPDSLADDREFHHEREFTLWLCEVCGSMLWCNFRSRNCIRPLR